MLNRDLYDKWDYRDGQQKLICKGRNDSYSKSPIVYKIKQNYTKISPRNCYFAKSSKFLLLKIFPKISQ